MSEKRYRVEVKMIGKIGWTTEAEYETREAAQLLMGELAAEMIAQAVRVLEVKELRRWER